MQSAAISQQTFNRVLRGCRGTARSTAHINGLYQELRKQGPPQITERDQRRFQSALSMAKLHKWDGMMTEAWL
ncbi:hypothetical protein [Glutamicibacter arilaitensis]|uniref:hypothetical protein n=1 Tax=Glutamicibacter arilaitensis TaxID=256701 RepID=UPI00384D8C33